MFNVTNVVPALHEIMKMFEADVMWLPDAEDAAELPQGT